MVYIYIFFPVFFSFYIFTTFLQHFYNIFTTFLQHFYNIFTFFDDVMRILFRHRKDNSHSELQQGRRQCPPHRWDHGSLVGRMSERDEFLGFHHQMRMRMLLLMWATETLRDSAGQIPH
jgi:hypothetical protein